MSNHYFEPPEDNRKVAANCTKCDEDILEYEECFITHEYQAVFCSEECMKSHFDIKSHYFERG